MTEALDYDHLRWERPSTRADFRATGQRTNVSILVRPRSRGVERLVVGVVDRANSGLGVGWRCKVCGHRGFRHTSDGAVIALGVHVAHEHCDLSAEDATTPVAASIHASDVVSHDAGAVRVIEAVKLEAVSLDTRPGPAGGRIVSVEEARHDPANGGAVPLPPKG